MKARAPDAAASDIDVDDEEPVTTTRRVLPQVRQPRTRGECAGVPRPCPFTACRYNLVLDRDEAAVENTSPEASCSLDVADRGGATLEDIADIFGVTRERIRQIEERALARIRLHGIALVEFAPARSSTRWNRLEGGERAFVPAEGEGTSGEPEPSAAEEKALERASFFTPHESADKAVCASVWNMLTKRQGPPVPDR